MSILSALEAEIWVFPAWTPPLHQCRNLFIRLQSHIVSVDSLFPSSLEVVFHLVGVSPNSLDAAITSVQQLIRLLIVYR